MRSETFWQLTLIFLGIIVTAMLLIFFFREVFPEYRIYQDAFVSLEEFRSTYTGEKPAPFKVGVKQIVIPSETNGPPIIDRCISCHVALEISDYSPTKIGKDISGNILTDEKGWPVQVPNENYIWKKLDQKIADLTNPDENQRLTREGKDAEVRERLKEAEKLQSLKIAHVGEHEYGMPKVLAMHPLIGKETHPFEFHPIDTYGCVSCHNGNGRGLVTDRAHGAIYDETYEVTYEGPKPSFLEKDVKNDPKFSHAYNEMPGERLLFQTTPLFVGKTIQANCVQCHMPSKHRYHNLFGNLESLNEKLIQKDKAIEKSYLQEKNNLLTLLNLRRKIQEGGFKQTVKSLEIQAEDLTQPKETINAWRSQSDYLKRVGEAHILEELDRQLIELVGSVNIANQLVKQINSEEEFENALKEIPQKKGKLFEKFDALMQSNKFTQTVSLSQKDISKEINQKSLSSLTSDIDLLTKSYQSGQQLYLNQACYACHRITGFSRGGVGPELTKEGFKEPWFIKQSIVWPQADLRTSTMPNQRLDHDEVESLLTYLLAQKGENRTISSTSYQENARTWEAGKKMPWENPVSPTEIFNLQEPMMVFATQGCAGCHRLKGFESNVGFSIQKDNKESSFDEIYKQHQWFKEMFPEEILGTQIVEKIEANKDFIEKHISENVRHDSILERIENAYPNTLEAFYSNFKYALRAKNYTGDTKQINSWKRIVRQVLMLYIQEYGLGKLIGPRLNWSGVFRTDEWLMEHFWNPALHSPRSLMPIFPFDDTKFLSLTYMLDALGKRNAKELREVWDHRGFNPETVVNTLCSQCHGQFLHGDGPVSEWIYPLPKNLRDPVFLHSLSRERVIQSITHGVKGTPMPPWGEIAQDKLQPNTQPVLNQDEIEQIADWLFNTLPGEDVIQSDEVSKWRYMPEDFLKELKDEQGIKHILPQFQKEKSSFSPKVLVLPFIFQPFLAVSQELSVEDIFDVKPNPLSGAEKNAYYIKKMYYTKENLEKGEDFFVLNCSVCHGKDADGSGIRAATMSEAKPRMLTNLDWINSRDDLRLLRSIKYGIPGTSMTPWGDFTNALQRMQLVMYIRSLNQYQAERENLSEILYKLFSKEAWNVEQERLNAYNQLIETELKYKQVLQNRKDENLNNEQKISLYEEELALEQKLQKQKLQDDNYLKLIQLLKQQKELFNAIGKEFLAINDEVLVQDFFTFLTFKENNDNASETKAHLDKIVGLLNSKINSSKDPNEIKKYTLAKETLLSNVAEEERIKKAQNEIRLTIEKNTIQENKHD